MTTRNPTDRPGSLARRGQRGLVLAVLPLLVLAVWLIPHAAGAPTSRVVQDVTKPTKAPRPTLVPTLPRLTLPTLPRRTLPTTSLPTTTSPPTTPAPTVPPTPPATKHPHTSPPPRHLPPPVRLPPSTPPIARTTSAQPPPTSATSPSTTDRSTTRSPGPREDQHPVAGGAARQQAPGHLGRIHHDHPRRVRTRHRRRPRCRRSERSRRTTRTSSSARRCGCRSPCCWC